MKIKGLITEDFVNYKEPSMIIEFPYCTFKCDKECGLKVCQNSHLAQESNKDIPIEAIVNLYLQNEITSAIVFQGLEPFDSKKDCYDLISLFREYTTDDIVIYTGYNEDELTEEIEHLKQYKNIIIKFGRFIPNNKLKYDKILGVNLASANQYAKRIS